MFLPVNSGVFGIYNIRIGPTTDALKMSLPSSVIVHIFLIQFNKDFLIILKFFSGFLEEVDTVRRHSVAQVPVGKNRNTPVLVHCGAGVGRTGVTIACDVLLTSLDHNIVRLLFIFFFRKEVIIDFIF